MHCTHKVLRHARSERILVDEFHLYNISGNRNDRLVFEFGFLRIENKRGIGTSIRRGGCHFLGFGEYYSLWISSPGVGGVTRG